MGRNGGIQIDRENTGVGPTDYECHRDSRDYTLSDSSWVFHQLVGSRPGTGPSNRPLAGVLGCWQGAGVRFRHAMGVLRPSSPSKGKLETG